MPTRVAGYDEAQIANAAIIASVAAAWNMGDRGALLGVMCAMGESSLRNIDYGDWETNGVRNPDGTPTTSIGLFQQQTWWGTPADRMDPIYSSWKFFEALKKISGWRDLEPTIAIHRVQINADPNHYARYESAARAVLDAIPELRAKGIIMADPMDIIEVPWQPGNYARRALVDAVARAGKPRGNSWGRLKDEQQRAWNAYQNGTGNPADNPNDPNNYELGHVRFAAVDIDYSPEMDRKLKAQGLVTPFSWESWHYRLPGDVRKWPLVTSIPSTAGSDATPFDPEEEDMSYENDAALRARLDQIVAFMDSNFRGLTGKVGGEGDQTRRHVDARISDLAGWTRDDANSIRTSLAGLSVAGTDPVKIAAALAPLIPAGASAKEVADEIGKRFNTPS